MPADRDDRPIREFVDGVMCFPRPGIAQAIDNVFCRIQRAMRRGNAAVENVVQRRPGSRLRRRKSVHFSEVAIAHQDPEVRIENTQAVRRAFERRPQQHLRARLHRFRARAKSEPAKAETGQPQMSLQQFHHMFFVMKLISPGLI